MTSEPMASALRSMQPFPPGAAPLGGRRCSGLRQQLLQQQPPQLAQLPSSYQPPSLPSLRVLGNHQLDAPVHHALQGALMAATAPAEAAAVGVTGGALPPLSLAPLLAPRRMVAADGGGCACGVENTESCSGICVACPSRGRMALGALGGPRAQRGLSPMPYMPVTMR